jgi:hypothetical protein
VAGQAFGGVSAPSDAASSIQNQIVFPPLRFPRKRQRGNVPSALTVHPLRLSRRRPLVCEIASFSKRRRFSRSEEMTALYAIRKAFRVVTWLPRELSTKGLGENGLRQSGSACQS